MSDIKIIEFSLENGKVAIFQYVGQDDPVDPLNEAVYLYTGGTKYTEMDDINMDNPWVRVVISDLDKIQEGGIIRTNDIIRDWRLKNLLN